MAKKRKKKKNAAPKRRNPPPKSNPKRRRGARRRRNPGGGSILGVVGGVVVGGVVAGALDYGMAGMAVTASPTRRALVFGGLTVVTTIAAVMTDGTASDVLTGVAGAQGGLAVANTSRAVALWVASKDDAKVEKTDKTAEKGKIAAVHMSSVVARDQAGAPPQLAAPRRVDRSNLRAVVMGERRA